MTSESDGRAGSAEGAGGELRTGEIQRMTDYGFLKHISRKGRFAVFSTVVVCAVVLQSALFLNSRDGDSDLNLSSPVASPISKAVADSLPAMEEAADAAQTESEEQALGGPISDYEQALQVDKELQPEAQPNVTVLEPVTSEETLVPTGDTGYVSLLSSDLESLASTPLVLTKSSVRAGDSLISIFRRNNLQTKHALALRDTPGTKAASILYPGDQFKFAWSDNKLLGIELRRKQKIALMVTYDGSQFSVVSKNAAKQAGSLVKLLKREVETVEQKDLIDFETQYAELKNSDLTWESVTVARGDALSKIFRRVGLSSKMAIEVASYPGNEWLATGLKPGQKMNIAKTDNGKFAILEVPEHASAKVRLVFPVEGGYFVGFKQIKTEQQEHHACAEVKTNLYAAGSKVNLPREVINDFVNLYDSRVDFSRQLRRGDQFCIIYERSYVKGKPIRDISIKAASFLQKDSEIRAFRHIDDDGQAAYYDSQGMNMQGHFLRSPIKYARVVSNFSKSRYHPILKRNRPHYGVDYGAKTGTPIRATATGRVIKRAYYSGYGKLITLQHGSQYRTLYAHMSRFAEGTSIGSFVKQGQVIGYVGSTGLSTGPHLHYEFHVNGRHRDPLTYDMPKGEPIAEEYRDRFLAVVDDFTHRLASIDEPQVDYRPPVAQTASSQ